MSEWSDENRHDGMIDAFTRAKCACRDKIHEVWYSFGGHAVRVRVIGNRLAERLALPFAHLRCQKSDPSHARLTIDLWDQLETGISAGIDASPDPLSLSSRFSTSEDERFVTSVLQHSITSFDRQEEHIVGAALDADQLSLYEYGRPLHVPLSLWYNERGVPLIHAALISYKGDGILLAGSSGAGKTSSSLSCMLAGFHYLADDSAGLEIQAAGDFWGHSVYSSAFVDEQTIHRLPALSEHAIPGKYSYEDKQLVFVSQAGSPELMRRTRIRVVCLVRITDGDRSGVRPATKRESLLTLTRSLLLSGVLSSGKRGFELLGRLSDNVPSFWLEVGPDPEDIPRCIRTLLLDNQSLTERRAV
ncbi:MAG: hypothetical protein V3T03_04155 [Candidatus Bipolaricaulota bacterium]